MTPRKGPTEIRPSLGGKSLPQGNRHAKDGAALLKTFRQLLASGYQGCEPGSHGPQHQEGQGQLGPDGEAPSNFSTHVTALHVEPRPGESHSTPCVLRFTRRGELPGAERISTQREVVSGTSEYLS